MYKEFSLVRQFLREITDCKAESVTMIGEGIFINADYNAEKIIEKNKISTIPFIKISNQFNVDKRNRENYDRTFDIMLKKSQDIIKDQEEKLFCSMIQKIDAQYKRFDQIDFFQNIPMKILASRKTSSNIHSHLSKQMNFINSDVKIISNDYLDENEIIFIEDEKFIGFLPIRQDLVCMNVESFGNTNSFQMTEEIGMKITNPEKIKRFKIKKKEISKFKFIGKNLL